MIANRNPITLLPTAYLAPIQYFSKLKKYSDCIIEHFEHLPKQTYRSRCEIYSPNGTLTLSIPIVKRNQRQVMKDVKIANDYDWQKLHWRSLEACYRSSPFFEFYEDDFYPFYHNKKFDYLIDLNEAVQQEIIKLLKLKTSYRFSTEYLKTYDNTDDYRNSISPKKVSNVDVDFIPPVYMQVFENKLGFIPNLSIVDLLFNQGPRALEAI